MALVGLKDIHAAIIQPSGIYDIPKKIAGAITANITPNSTRSVLYGDDQAIAISENFVDVDVEINISDLSTANYALLLGKTINADGMVIDSVDDIAPYLALGFKSQKENGAYRYMWLYKGKFSVPAETYNTKGESVEFQTSTLVGKFIADDDGNWRSKVDSDDPGVEAYFIDGWFSAVQV